MENPGSETPDTSQGVVEARFAVSDPAYPFVWVTQEAGCRVELEKMLPRESEGYTEFFSVTGADPDRILELAEASDLVEPRLVAGYENGGLFEFIVTGFCPAQDLVELGAIPQAVIGENGEGYIVVEIPPDEETSSIIERFLDDHPSATLAAKETKERSTPLFTTEELELAVDQRLTERQQELLQAAFEAGYYEQPSETTGAELADEFGISSATLSQHLAAAERKLISILVQDKIGSPSV